MKKTDKRMILYCILFVGIVIGITAVLLPYFRKISDPVYQSEISKWVHQKGMFGVLMVVGIQILQIIIAVIPGEPVELLSGVLYGTIGGLALCLLGSLIGSLIIFLLSGHFGKKLLYTFFKKEKVQSWKWLKDSKKCTMATFLLFLIPGTPKDLLTYIIGVTDMKVGKFLVISSLARIPSVVSSTMLGANMRSGNWKVSVLVFLLTGIVGIIGIGYKEKIIDFCRRHSMRDNFGETAGECMDFVETVHRRTIYPLIYCYIEIAGHLDICRLKAAIRKAGHYVPEIRYVYNFKRGKFQDIGLTVDDIVLFDKSLKQWDLSKKPQLQIHIDRREKKDFVTIGISHILTDGQGFLQFLYLLSALYREPYVDLPYRNQREVSPFLENIKVQKQTEQTRYGKRKKIFTLRNSNKGTHDYCLTSRISEDDFSMLHAKAKMNGVPLNDVFMTAYARVIARLKNVDTVVLPCPVDLRKVKAEENKLTVANLTGMYRRITIEIKPQHNFSETLTQIHIEMELQKSRHRCYAGIKSINRVYHKMPHVLLEKMIKVNYQVLPISYTNIGQIDSNKFYFDDCRIKSCYITGTYRKSPDFQLSISTFRDLCTLNCTLRGEQEDEQIGQYILEQVKKELLDWGKTGNIAGKRAIG